MVNVVWISGSYSIVITQAKIKMLRKILLQKISFRSDLPVKGHKELSIISELLLEEDKWYYSGTEKLKFCINLRPKNTEFCY